MVEYLSRITFDDFDRGVVTTLGGELIDFVIDGQPRKVYAVRVPDVESKIPQYNGMVPISIAKPKDIFRPYQIPCFVIRVQEPESAFDRAPWYGWESYPAKDGKLITVQLDKNTKATGWDKRDLAWKPYPFNMGYEVTGCARNAMEGNAILHWMLRRFRPPFFSMEAYGSEGERRLYDAGPVSVANASEVISISDRLIAWTVSFQAWAEIDLALPATSGISGEEDFGILVQYPNVNYHLYHKE